MPTPARKRADQRDSHGLEVLGRGIPEVSDGPIFVSVRDGRCARGGDNGRVVTMVYVARRGGYQELSMTNRLAYSAGAAKARALCNPEGRWACGARDKGIFKSV